MNDHFIEIEVIIIIINLGNIFTKNRVALVSLGINYCRNLTNDNCVEIIGSNKEIHSIPPKI